MNHHYPDSYPGYGRNTGSMQGMGYGGSYGDPASMARMGHPRDGYQMTPYPMMQQPGGGVYPHGNYMGQQRGNPYNMANYSNYGMSGMNQNMMMSNRQGDMSRMSGGNMMNSYYGANMASDTHPSPQPSGMTSHPPSYSHNQSSSHMQPGHMGMMAVQGQQAMPGQSAMGSVSGQNQAPPTIPGQPMVGQGGQLNHGASHMPDVSPHQSSGPYAGQGSPLLMSRGHHVPQHPMRHPTTQQNPQEVADNILQMASAYPSNQTVQVPLKSRPAPYHIPRSPHYSVAHSDLSHTSPTPHQQTQQSPAATCQASPTPSSSSVKSPTPVLAPIPNPIPSPGISGLKSPCNQGMSPCGTQRSPAHMGSTYSGHSQGGPPSQCGSEGTQLHHGMSPSESQHYSPCNMTPTHNYSPYNASPSAQRSTTMYSPCSDPSIVSNAEQIRQSYSSPPSSSPCANNFSSYANTSKHCAGQTTNSHPVASMAQNVGSNPLMSLQKLVMLPETQVVDPKSVVNDACLSAQQNEGSKNVDGPAERLAEGSSHSVGCQVKSSSHEGHVESANHPIQTDEMVTSMAHPQTMVSASNTSSQHLSTPPQPDNQEQGSVSGQDNLQKSLCESGSNNQPDISELESSNISQNETTLKHPQNNMAVDDSGTSNPAFEESMVNRCDNESVSTETVCASSSPNDVSTVLQKDLPISEQNSGPMTQEVGDLKDTSPSVGNGKVSGNDGPCSPMAPDRKNKIEAKCLVVQCRSPGVLSEVPVVANGLTTTACGNDDDLEQDCGNGVHTKIQNAFSSLVKAKFARAKRTSQFSCVTPCSIAVGADERAACERFAFRRNGYCRTLRTSRVVCPGRNRNDSSGNGDSDESLENVSERYFGHTESPQDGNRKRTSNAAKRRDNKRPNLTSVSASSKISDSDSKPAESMTSGSNGCMSHNNEAVSDDDICYYEGVDNTDIFINGSSDESITSSGEVKQNSSVKGAGDKTIENHNQGETAVTVPSEDKGLEKQNENSNIESKEAEHEEVDSEIVTYDQNHSASTSQKSTTDKLDTSLPSSSPAKRLRRSSGQKAHEKLKALSVSKKSISSSGNISDKAEVTVDLTIEPEHQAVTHVSQSILPDLEDNAKEQPKRLRKFKPSILDHQSAGKYPVVVLEKSKVCVNQSPLVVKQEVVDQDAAAEHLRSNECSNHVSEIVKERELTACDMMKDHEQIKVEKGNVDDSFNESTDVKGDLPENNEQSDVRVASTVSTKHGLKKKTLKKKKHVKNKGKGKVLEKTNRHLEVKDSFKSMKFSRTLDLMKSQRKRETTSVGPFIRVCGKQSAPDSVSVFNQPISDFSGLSAGAKHKHSKNKKAYSMPMATTIHMVTNLPTDKTAIVPSTRTISQAPWVCVFCAHHSSYKSLGDLFGPYYKENEMSRVESIAQEESKKSDSNKDPKVPESGTSARKSREMSAPDRKGTRKAKTGPSKPVEMSPLPVPPEEIWVHEACAMWSPGVYLVGNKIYGLDEAVKDAAETICSVCKSKGAMIGCLHKGCSMKYHFICAVDKDCLLDEENFSLLCSKHKDKRLSSAGLTRS